MHVISNKTLKDFYEKHKDAEHPLKTWFHMTKHATWSTPVDVINDVPNARTIPNNRAVFKIKGDNYRLVVGINYKFGKVFIKFVGTHEEYDKIDATTIEWRS